MEEFATQLVQKTGLSEENARKVVDFVQEHWDEIPGWLSKDGLQEGIKDAVADKLPGGLGDLLR